MKQIKKTEAYIRDIYTHQLQITTDADLDQKILARSRHVLEEQKNKTAPSELSIWRHIMKSRITKIAAAAVILLAAVFGIYHLIGSVDITTPAFADIIQPLLTAETGQFNMTINVIHSGLDWIQCGDQPVQTIRVSFAGPSRTRWDVPTGEVLIANMEYGKVMILMPASMQAAVMQVGPPGFVHPHNRFNKVLQLRRLIRFVLETDGEAAEFLGDRQIDGVSMIGYRLAGPMDHGEIVVWADAENRIPVRIEQTMGTETAVISDIVYDIALDESLFSVEPPAGYAVGTPGEDDQPKFIVKGIVTDAVTGEPVAGAKVSDDGYGPEPRRGAVTDSEGRYQYQTWPEEHGIKAEAPGYKIQRKGISGLFHVDTEEGRVINFKLERE